MFLKWMTNRAQWMGRDKTGGMNDEYVPRVSWMQKTHNYSCHSHKTSSLVLEHSGASSARTSPHTAALASRKHFNEGRGAPSINAKLQSAQYSREKQNLICRDRNNDCWGASPLLTVRGYRRRYLRRRVHAGGGGLALKFASNRNIDGWRRALAARPSQRCSVCVVGRVIASGRHNALLLGAFWKEK